MNPLISIIMPAYNAGNYIAEAITSIKNQTYQNWELIVVDDQSSDNSLEIAKQFESDKVKIYSKSNGGAASARNFGYYRSKGEFIKFFDSDDIINSDMITSQVELAIQNPNCVISGKWGRFYKDSLDTFQLNYEKCWQDMDPINWLCSSWSSDQSMTQPGIFLIPKTIIEKAGAWDERLNLIDDFEFFARIILNSDLVKFSKDATLFYRSGISKSLSAIKSDSALASAFLSFELGTKYLLEKEDSKKTRLVCADLFQAYIYEYYPLAPTLLKKASEKVVLLGGSTKTYRLGGIYNLVCRIAGWKTAKQLQKIKFNL